jgi:hypothetical protein
MRKQIFIGLALATVLAGVLALGLAGCRAAAPSPSPTPGGGAVIRSDSVVTGQITALKAQAAGYPWEVSLRLVSSEDVDGLPNPTKDSVGEVITAQTDETLASFQVGEAITANVKLSGDVEHGIILYIFNIRPE